MEIFSPSYLLLLGFIASVTALTTIYLIQKGVSQLLAEAENHAQPPHRKRMH